MAYDKPQGNRQKKYYQITKDGKSAFSEWLKAPIDFADSTDQQLAKIFFFDKLLNIERKSSILLGVVLFVRLLLMPKETFLLSVLLTLNFAGASGDFVQICMACKYPKHTYFSDNGDVTTIY